jgi:hypothetical protein
LSYGNLYKNSEANWRMPPSGMLRLVALVRIDVSEQRNIPEDIILPSHRREYLKS